jgi:hypothetical protein
MSPGEQNDVAPPSSDGAAPPTSAADAPRRDPALADAEALLTRARADEAAAAAARDRYRTQLIEALPSDPTISPLVADDEPVYAIRASAILNTTTGASPIPGYGGTLYLTGRRLLHVGRVVVSISLDQVREMSLAGERLLVTLDGGEGITLDVDRPRLLRVEIAAAMLAARSAR